MARRLRLGLAESRSSGRRGPLHRLRHLPGAPFLEPLRDRQAILEYWIEVARTEKDISFGYEILAVREQFGIARWQASFVRTPPGLPTKLDGIFVISLNAEGKCTSLREWWHKQQ